MSISHSYQSYPHDIQVIELATVTMLHAICAVLFNNDKPDPKVLKLINLPTVLEVTLENMRKPISTYYMMNHAIPLLTSSTLHCPEICHNYPPILKFPAACLHSKDLTVCYTAMGGLIRLHHHEAKPERVFHDPQKLIDQVLKGFPDHIADIMMDYGLIQCNTYATLQATHDFQKAMMAVVQDHDLLTLGRTLAELIVRTEFSIAKGSFEAEDPRTGKREAFNTSLPFTLWTESLPVCASKLRQTGQASDVDLADILQIKFFIIWQNILDAVVKAKAAIDRNLDIAYWYYTISLGANDEDGLRFAKKGLQCKHITNFLKFAMLYRAVEHAGSLAVTKLQEASQGDKTWEEGYAFLTSALDDAKEFIQRAPPDSRHLQNMLNWYIILTITYKGPEISVQLDELQVGTIFSAFIRQW